MITQLFIALSIFSVSLGQIGRIPLSNRSVNLYLWDIFLVLALISWLVSYRDLIWELLSGPVLREGVLFGLTAVVTLLLSLRLFAVSEVLIGSLYLWRWLVYFLLIPMTMTVFRNQKVWLVKVMVLSGLLVALGGWIQLRLFPDLTPLVRYGWDPHQSRLVSTLLDPNFTGAILVIALVWLTAYQLEHRQRWLPAILGGAFLYLSLVYTFSRSAYLMFLTSFLAIGYLRSWKVGLVAILAFFVSLQVNPRVEERVGGAVVVDASAVHRLTSWEKAWLVVKKHPVFGVGFNNFRFAQLKEGLIDQNDPLLGGHAGAGTDSSFLFILVTTGFIGGLAFAFFLFRIFGNLLTVAKEDWLTLASFASLFGLLFHAQFVNSLFYPPVMVFLFSGLGLALKRDNAGD